MIKTEVYEQALFETIKRGATVISDDVKEAFEAAIKRESNPDAKKGLQATLDSMQMSQKRENPLCVDTGWPIFYFKVGNTCEIEGGFVELENAARRAVEKATKLGYLRATMKHPLTGFDPTIAIAFAATVVNRNAMIPTMSTPTTACQMLSTTPRAKNPNTTSSVTTIPITTIFIEMSF